MDLLPQFADVLSFATKQLSPFVTMEMEPTNRVEERNGTYYRPAKINGMEFLRSWKKLNPAQFDQVVDGQEEERAQNQRTAYKQSFKEEVPEQISSQVSKSGQNPLQQQQTRSMHTSSRRMVSAQATPTTQDPSQPPKEWNDMSRPERKVLVNTATTQKLRQVRKESGDKRKIPQKEKKKLKQDLKSQLIRKMIGAGILEDQKASAMISTDEGRRRKREGLPRATLKEKEEFWEDIIANPRKAKAILEEHIRIAGMGSEEVTPTSGVLGSISGQEKKS